MRPERCATSDILAALELQMLHILLGYLPESSSLSSQQPTVTVPTTRPPWGSGQLSNLTLTCPLVLGFLIETVPGRDKVQGAVSDEQLMSDIQQDLSSSVPQEMLPLTAKDASASATGSTASSKENE